MTRLNVWNPCNRVVDEKLHESRREGHRARLESIHNSYAQNVAKPTSAGPQRGTTTTSFKALPKSKSPAAKSRQAEIERENLKMLKKIVELQRTSGLSGSDIMTGNSNTSVSGKRRSRPASASTRSGPTEQNAREYFPNPLTGLAPGGDLGVPTAVSHALYTRHSATMTHHFEEQNDVALNFVPGKHYSTAATRQRTHVQIVHENRKMLQRVLASKTTFSRATWQAQESERRKMLNNISRFSRLAMRRSPSSSASSLPTARSRLQQDGRGLPSRSLDRQCASQPTLIMVDHIGGGQRFDLSNAVRTGSPVTHLRQHPRPQSASAASSARHVYLCRGSEMSNSDQDSVTHAMSQVGIVEDGSATGDEEQSQDWGQRDIAYEGNGDSDE